MIPKIENFKRRRETLGISQKQFAKMCNLKASTLNMIENGNAKPSFEVYKKIDEILDKEEDKVLSQVKTAGQICKKKIEYVKKSDPVDDIVNIMHEKDYSQLPVFEHNRCVGLVTERSILKYMNENAGTLDKFSTKAQDVMEPKPPEIDWDYKITPRVLDLLYDAKCILVSKNNKIVGIITKIDAIRSLKK